MAPRMRNLVICLSFLPALVLAQPNASAAGDTYGSALAAAKSGQLDSAMALVERAIAQDPRHAKALKLRGDLYQRQDNAEAALADYKASEEIDPNNARLYISRAALRISKGMEKTALKDCEKAIQIDPTDPDGFYNRACALYIGGNTEAARKDAERAVKLKPDHADALYLSGVANGELYLEEDGLHDIAEALKLKPAIPGGMMSMAVLLYEAERYEEAIDRFTEAMAVDTAELAAAHWYRGDCYYHLKNKEKACEDFKASAALKDKDALFIRKNYCETDLERIPKKPVKKKRKSMIEF
jgi:tetratricopeptide (TPR) repeat protein